MANAGPDTTALIGATVTLNGAASSDVDGDPLTFAWSFVSRPDGSGATLSDPSSATPVIAIDVFGVYVVQLVVNDGTVDSTPDTVAVTTTNSRPIARAGADQDATVGIGVTLDGSGSTDVDGDPLAIPVGAHHRAGRQHRGTVQ